jgi:hypothetical protein
MLHWSDVAKDFGRPHPDTGYDSVGLDISRFMIPYNTSQALNSFSRKPESVTRRSSLSKSSSPQHSRREAFNDC